MALSCLVYAYAGSPKPCAHPESRSHATLSLSYHAHATFLSMDGGRVYCSNILRSLFQDVPFCAKVSKDHCNFQVNEALFQSIQYGRAPRQRRLHWSSTHPISCRCRFAFFSHVSNLTPIPRVKTPRKTSRKHPLLNLKLTGLSLFETSTRKAVSRRM